MTINTNSPRSDRQLYDYDTFTRPPDISAATFSRFSVLQITPSIATRRGWPTSSCGPTPSSRSTTRMLPYALPRPSCRLLRPASRLGRWPSLVSPSRLMTFGPWSGPSGLSAGLRLSSRPTSSPLPLWPSGAWLVSRPPPLCLPSPRLLPPGPTASRTTSGKSLATLLVLLLMACLRSSTTSPTFRTWILPAWNPPFGGVISLRAPRASRPPAAGSSSRSVGWACASSLLFGRQLTSPTPTSPLMSFTWGMTPSAVAASAPLPAQAPPPQAPPPLVPLRPLSPPPTSNQLAWPASSQSPLSRASLPRTKTPKTTSVCTTSARASCPVLMPCGLSSWRVSLRWLAVLARRHSQTTTSSTHAKGAPRLPSLPPLSGPSLPRPPFRALAPLIPTRMSPLALVLALMMTCWMLRRAWTDVSRGQDAGLPLNLG